MLGDTDVGMFVPRIQQLAAQSALEALNPFGGWQAIYADFVRTLPPTLSTSDIATSPLLLDGEAPLGIGDFARIDVLVGLLSSFLRCPLPRRSNSLLHARSAPRPLCPATALPRHACSSRPSDRSPHIRTPSLVTCVGTDLTAFALKAPAPFLGFAATLTGLTVTAESLDAALDASMTTGEVWSLPVAAAGTFFVVQNAMTVLLARLMLVAFLEVRGSDRPPPNFGAMRAWGLDERRRALDWP